MYSEHILPSPSQGNLTNQGDAYIKLLGYMLEKPPLGPHLAYLTDIVDCDLNFRCPCTPSALGQHVISVIFIRTQKQVTRAHARWIVAPMANHKLTGIGPAGDKPSQSTGNNNFVVNHKPTVPTRASERFPWPTFIRATAVNVGPKACDGFSGDVWQWSMLDGHGWSLLGPSQGRWGFDRASLSPLRVYPIEEVR